MNGVKRGKRFLKNGKGKKDWTSGKMPVIEACGHCWFFFGHGHLFWTY